MALYYFGFGANKDAEMIEAIVGRRLDGRPAFIEGFDLVIQALADIPEQARVVLRKVWGDSFESYAILRGSKRVHGMLWKVTRKDLAHIAKWELEAENWFKQIEVVAVVEEEGSKVAAITQIVENQPYQKIVTKKDYAPFPVPKRTLIEIAIKVREGLL